MARLAEQKSTTNDVKALARKIREGQERERSELQQFAKGRPETPAGTSGQHRADMKKDAKESLARIRRAAGREADWEFLDEMAKHHEMAIHMIRDTRFDNAKLKGMADKMAANQAREIEELKRMRQRVS